MNVPLPPGATGDVYLRAFDEVIAPVVERVRADVAARLGRVRRPPRRPAHRARPDGRRLRAADARGRCSSCRPAGAWRCSRAATTSTRSSACAGAVLATLAGVDGADDRGADQRRPRRRGGRRRRAPSGQATLIAAGRRATSPRSLARRHGPRPLRRRPRRAGAARRALRRGRAPAVPRRRRGARPARRRRRDGPATSTSPPTPGPPEIKALLRGLGRRGVDPGRAVRHDRRPRDRPDGTSLTVEITTFRAEATPTTRASRDVTFADDDRGRPRPPRLHDQRDGARAAPTTDADARRSVRRRGRPRHRRRCARRWRRRSASTTTRCGCCGRPGSSPATA